MASVLDRIETAEDLKRLSKEQLQQLSTEIRQLLLHRLSKTGGHVGSNLGMIEATIALHYVFHSPVDKIIFDVSHQCYTHKLLTGRKAAYIDPDQYGTVTGFTNPSESEHDIFSIGHTSTAISLACGLAKARDAKGETSNVIAIVGDGSLSGGEAFEGLNNAAVLGSNIVIVNNDNDMSIAENHGGLYQNLSLLRTTGGRAECNIFKALGFSYAFVADGNDLPALLNTFQMVKDTPRPTVIHICTIKGKGYLPAEADQESWHYHGPFDLKTGVQFHQPNGIETYEDMTRDYLIKKMQKDPAVIAITAGTPKIFGFDEKLRRQYPKQFIDVGIAEGHAITFASGIAKNGGKPVFGVSSSFIQRAYDQLSQDMALNRSPAVILVFFGGISQSSQTHMGVFDISLIMNIPNITCLAPTCKEEYFSMLDWAIEQNETPVMIRIPGIATTSRHAELPASYSLPVQYEITDKGSKVAILALGKFFALGQTVRKTLAAKNGIHATLINPRYITGVDQQVLERLKADHQLVITLEDGVIDGGFGQKIAGYYGNSTMKVINFGAKKEFIDNVQTDTLYQQYHLMAGQIVSDILSLL